MNHTQYSTIVLSTPLCMRSYTRHVASGEKQEDPNLYLVGHLGGQREQLNTNIKHQCTSLTHPILAFDCRSLFHQHFLNSIAHAH